MWFEGNYATVAAWLFRFSVVFCLFLWFGLAPRIQLPFSKSYRHSRAEMFAHRRAVLGNAEDVPRALATLVLVTEESAPAAFQDKREAAERENRRREAASAREKRGRAGGRAFADKGVAAASPNAADRLQSERRFEAELLAETEAIAAEEAKVAAEKRHLHMESLVNFVAFNRNQQTRAFLLNGTAPSPPPRPLPRPEQLKARRADPERLGQVRSDAQLAKDKQGNIEASMVLSGALELPTSDASVAWGLYSQLLELGVEVAATTYELMADQCLKAGDLKSASDFMMRMEANDLPPSPVLLDRIMELYLSQKQETENGTGAGNLPKKLNVSPIAVLRDVAGNDDVTDKSASTKPARSVEMLNSTLASSYRPGLHPIQPVVDMASLTEPWKPHPPPALSLGPLGAGQVVIPGPGHCSGSMMRNGAAIPAVSAVDPGIGAIAPSDSMMPPCAAEGRVQGFENGLGYPPCSFTPDPAQHSVGPGGLWQAPPAHVPPQAYADFVPDLPSHGLRRRRPVDTSTVPTAHPVADSTVSASSAASASRCADLPAFCVPDEFAAEPKMTAAAVFANGVPTEPPDTVHKIESAENAPNGDRIRISLADTESWKTHPNFTTLAPEGFQAVFAMLSGEWRSDRLQDWTFLPDGHTLIQGKYWGPQYDIHMDTVGPVYIPALRQQGQELDVHLSTKDCLVWVTKVDDWVTVNTRWVRKPPVVKSNVLSADAAEFVPGG